jgi:DNA-binding IclR family transcriptional regulator
MLNEIKAQGYATATRSRRMVEEIGLSVPVLLNDRVLAALTVRFASSALPLKTGVERFLPKLRHCAAAISRSFSDQQSGANLTDVVASTPSLVARSASK